MTTASDSFTRANETPLASPWATSYGSGMNLTSNVAVSTASTDKGSYYTGTWGNDQESMGTIGALTTNSQYAGLLVRANGSGNAYQVITDGTTGAGHTEFGYWSGGSYSSLNGIATTFANGNGMRLTVSGASPNIILTLYKDTGSGWVQVGQQTGISVGPASGNPGVGCYGVATIDDWSATDNAAAGTNPKGPLGNPFFGPFGGPI